ncbi:MAG: hypothetical protein ACYC35_18090, partial [Pirellulales bacterium]
GAHPCDRTRGNPNRAIPITPNRRSCPGRLLLFTDLRNGHLGPYYPLPVSQDEDYLALTAVILVTAGATAGVLLSAILGWSYRALHAIGLVGYLARRRKALVLGAFLAILVGSASCVVWAYVYVPISYGLRFHRAIEAADRLVIRHGGFDCCGSVDGQRILFDVVDPAQIAEVRQNLEFVWGLPDRGCACCGYPGMDWYCGQTRVALTSVQHWKAIRWSGFKGDAHLTAESSLWLEQWLKAHGVTSDSPY